MSQGKPPSDPFGLAPLPAVDAFGLAPLSVGNDPVGLLATGTEPTATKTAAPPTKLPKTSRPGWRRSSTPAPDIPSFRGVRSTNYGAQLRT